MRAAKPRSCHSTHVVCGTTGIEARAAGSTGLRARSASRAARVGGQRLERIQHLHGGRDDRVVLDALVVVVRLLAASCASRGARFCTARRMRRPSNASRRARRDRRGCVCANVHSRRRNRYAPSTPVSDHSSVAPAGWRTSRTGARCRRRSGRSASCGSTPLCFDFDIVPTPPYSTGCAVRLEHGAGDAPSSSSDSTSAGVK